MPTPNTFFLYTRKSTDEVDRQVYSIEHQLAELRQFAARKNLHVVAELTENRSAMTPGRPVFNEMLERIHKGEAAGILSWHPDRLARNSYDGHHITGLVEAGAIVSLEFAAYWFEPTPQGILMLEIAFGMSKYYSAALSQNIKRAQRQRLQDGHWPYRPPVGYVFDANTRNLVIDPIRGPLIRKAFELYATDEYSLDQLRPIMHAQGLTRPAYRGHAPGPMSRSHFHRMMQDPCYVGYLSSNGQRYEGKHEPLITTNLFDTCQVTLARKGNYRSSALKPFLYRGMFRCGECGCTVTMERQKGHTYLRCAKSRGKCSQGYLRQELVAEKVTRVLKKVVLDQDIIDSLIIEFEERQCQEITTWDQEIKNIKMNIAAFEFKLQRLANTYVDTAMPLESYNITKEKLLKQKRFWSDKLTFAQKHRKTPLEPLVSFIHGLTEARIVAQSGDELGKRDLLQKASLNLKIKDGNVLWTPVGAWKHVAEIGRLARRASRAQNVLNTPAEKRPAKCPATGAVRMAVESMYLIFKGAVVSA